MNYKIILLFFLFCAFGQKIIYIYHIIISKSYSGNEFNFIILDFEFKSYAICLKNNEQEVRR